MTFLVDTYDTTEGIAHAIEVIDELDLRHGLGIRIDSGDLAELARAARRALDDAGHPEVRIFVSGGLDEHDIAALVEGGAPIDAVGVGTRLGVSADAPFLDAAYKLVSYEGRPVAKLSEGKATYPGAKQVFRGDGLVDQLGLANEAAPPGTEPLLEVVMSNGKRAHASHPVQALVVARARFEADVAILPAPARALRDPEAPYPSFTKALSLLTEQVHSSRAH